MPSSPMNGVGPPFTLPSNIVYFFDWRYVDHGYMRYLTPDDKPIAVMPAPDPMPDVHCDWSWIPRGVRLQSVAAQPDPEPTLTAKQLDEPLFFGGSVIHDDGRYRMFYESIPADALGDPAKHKRLGHIKHLKLAESDDGVKWKFPRIGGEGNIVFRPGPVGYHGGCVTRDAHAPPNERYKSIFLGMISNRALEAYRRKWPNDVDPMAVHRNPEPGPDGIAAWGVCGAVSPDGVQWSLIEEPMLIQHSDTFQAMTFDEVRGKHVLYLRSWFFGRRSVARTESDDFRHFPAVEQILWPEGALEAGDTWYTPGYTRVPDAPDYHLMFPTHWSQVDDAFRPHLYSSPDGLIWSKVPGGAVGGPSEPAWCRCGWQMNTLVPLPGERVGALVGSWHVPHKYPRRLPGFGQCGWVSWQRGRLSCIKAERDGEFALYPLHFKGRRIILNYRTAMAGSIRVAIAGTKPYREFDQCDVINGNQLDRVVTWGGESALPHGDGEALQIRFRLNNAELFSVRFE